MMEMEIELLREQLAGPATEELVHDPKVHELLRQKAQAIFGGSIPDLKQERSQIDEVVDFAVRDCGCDGPQAFLELVNRMVSSQRGKGTGNLLEDLWRQVKLFQAHKALRALTSH